MTWTITTRLREGDVMLEREGERGPIVFVRPAEPKTPEDWAEAEQLARDLAKSEADADDYSQTIDRLSELLRGVADALKGDPGPLASHDWSDLPAVAADVVRERDDARELLAEERTGAEVDRAVLAVAEARWAECVVQRDEARAESRDWARRCGEAHDDARLPEDQEVQVWRHRARVAEAERERLAIETARLATESFSRKLALSKMEAELEEETEQLEFRERQIEKAAVELGIGHLEWSNWVDIGEEVVEAAAALSQRARKVEAERDRMRAVVDAARRFRHLSPRLDEAFDALAEGGA